jgi:hypothetical protein
MVPHHLLGGEEVNEADLDAVELDADDLALLDEADKPAPAPAAARSG